jgi:hypothetical protein
VTKKERRKLIDSIIAKCIECKLDKEWSALELFVFLEKLREQ